MKRRIPILAALVVLAVAATAALAVSRASYTTGSQSIITASADSAANWAHVYAQGTDPDGLTGYARQQNLATQPLIATGLDAGLAISWGSYPDLNKTFAFSRVLTIKTPAVFPDPAVTQVTVTVTLAPDVNGTQPLRNAYLHLTPGSGFTNTVTMRVNQKAQLDISLRTKKNPWDAGDIFRPHVILTLTYSGRTRRLLRLRLHDPALHHLIGRAATACGSRSR